MRVPRIEHLSAGDWHDTTPDPTRPIPCATLNTGWKRIDGETDERTCGYTLAGLERHDAIAFAEAQDMHPGFTVRVEQAHWYLGVPVVRAWAEIYDHQPPPDVFASLSIEGPDGVRFAVKCAPESAGLFLRIGQKMLQDVIDHTLSAVVRDLGAQCATTT